MFAPAKDRYGIALCLCAGLLFVSSVAVAGEAPSLIGRCATEIARTFEPLANPPVIDPAETPVGPPPDPQVGDTWNWYVWRLNGYPQADLKPCTVRGMGDHCYVVVDDEVWNIQMNQSQVDHIIQRFDNESIGTQPDLGIYDINVQTFGIPPDRLDNDDRVYLFYYDFDVNADGFFWYFDEYPNGSQPFASNECEVVYLNCSDNNPAGDYIVAVAAHEFEHMIHWEHDANEASWVDEGCGELAMWLYGYPDNISSFNSNPDNNLTVWDGAWADYIKTYLWTLYFYERYGGAAAIYELVHQPGNSTGGYELTLDAMGYTESFADVFADWVVANYLDDPSIGDGRWGYVGDELPPFADLDQTSYPVNVPVATVNYWAADYVKFLNATSGLELAFDGIDASQFAIWALEIDPVEPTRVTGVPLDALQVGAVSLPDVGSLYEHAVMVVGHNTAFGGTSYAYIADTGVTGIGETLRVAAVRPTLERPVPNPFNPSVTIRYTIRSDVARARLLVVDAAGRHVRTLLDGPLTAGESRLAWDGRNDDRAAVASGVYFFRLVAGEEVATTSATLIR